MMRLKHPARFGLCLHFADEAAERIARPDLDKYGLLLLTAWPLRRRTDRPPRVPGPVSRIGGVLRRHPGSVTLDRYGIVGADSAICFTLSANAPISAPHRRMERMRSMKLPVRTCLSATPLRTKRSPRRTRYDALLRPVDSRQRQFRRKQRAQFSSDNETLSISPAGRLCISFPRSVTSLQRVLKREHPGQARRRYSPMLWPIIACAGSPRHQQLGQRIFESEQGRCAASVQLMRSAADGLAVRPSSEYSISLGSGTAPPQR